jgi:hypothetical protein
MLLQKDGGAAYAVMEDVCYGAGDGINQKYFISMIPEWSVAIIQKLHYV